MEIAVQFEKFNLDENKFIFKPIGIIRGEYIREANCFISEFGVVYSSIRDDEPYELNYFYANTTIEELRKNYESNVPDEKILEDYLQSYMERCFMGFFDVKNQVINIAAIPYAPLESIFNTGSKTLLSSASVSDVDELKKISDLKTLKEIRKDLDNIIDNSNDRKLKISKEESKKIELKSMRKEVLSKIIGQDKAVNDITRTIITNYKSDNPRHKSHILVVGPSGTGKTEIMRIIAKYLDVPFFMADATAYTEEGYVGKSVDSMLLGLIDAADGDIEKAQNGILMIDEIDKKANHDSESVSGQIVLQSLLKIMDRDIVEINEDYYESIMFDTSNLTIIMCGAFTDLYEKKKNKRKIGFNNDNNIESTQIITEKDLINYGLTTEFVGRIGVITYTKDFSLEDLIDILKKSKISPLKFEKEFFKSLGIEITFTAPYIEEIAKRSLSSNEGARMLKKYVTESLSEVYEKVYSDKKVKKLTITKDTALDPTKYYVKY